MNRLFAGRVHVLYVTIWNRLHYLPFQLFQYTFNVAVNIGFSFPKVQFAPVRYGYLVLAMFQSLSLIFMGPNH